MNSASASPAPVPLSNSVERRVEALVQGHQALRIVRQRRAAASQRRRCRRRSPAIAAAPRSASSVERRRWLRSCSRSFCSCARIASARRSLPIDDCAARRDRRAGRRAPRRGRSMYFHPFCSTALSAAPSRASASRRAPRSRSRDPRAAAAPATGRPAPAAIARPSRSRIVGTMSTCATGSSDDAGRNRRSVDDQRHRQRRVVGEQPVRRLAVFAKRLAVIGRDDDQRPRRGCAHARRRFEQSRRASRRCMRPPRRTGLRPVRNSGGAS